MYLLYAPKLRILLRRSHISISSPGHCGKPYTPGSDISDSIIHNLLNNYQQFNLKSYIIKVNVSKYC